MRTRCSSTVSRPCHHRGACCEQVVHENAHAKKINKVLKTLDVVCNIILNGAGIIIRKILCWSVERGGGHGKTRKRISYNMMILCYRGRASPCRMRLCSTMSITSTRRPDDRTTGSSKYNVHQPTPRFRAFLCTYTDYILLFYRR